MGEILRAYKYILKPSKAQAELLNKHFGSTRFVYNHFLSERVEQYKETKQSESYVEQAKKLTILKKDKSTLWLNEVNSQALQFALKSVEVAYKNFFSGQNRFPKFKSRKSRNSFTIPQHIKLEYGRLRIPKFNEGIKTIVHRPIRGEIRNCTLSRSTTGKYYVSIVTKEYYNPQARTGKSVGCDLGITSLIVTSDNQIIKNHKYTKKYEKKLAKAQRHLSRKHKGSHSFENQKRKVALIHEKITNARHDHLHKVTTNLVRSYDVICIEDLNAKGMVKNRRLSKHIADASFGHVRRLLEYKAKWNEKKVVVVDRFFPSSKTCSICGAKNNNLTLRDRIFCCPNGHTLNRDLNAAKNLEKEGFRIIGAGLSDYTSGENVRGRKIQISLKLEAHPSVA